MKKITVILIVVFIIDSCSQHPDNIHVPDKTSYSGREIFTGLFFAQGPVATLIPEIRDNFNIHNVNLSPEQRNEMTNVQDELLDFIEHKHPSFFDSFKSDVTSGDHITIQNALSNAGKISMEAVEQYYKVQFSDKLHNLDPETKKVFLNNPGIQELLIKGNNLTIEDLNILLAKAGTASLFLKSDHEINGRGSCLIAWLGVFAMVAVFGGIESILFVHAAIAVYEWICAKPLEDFLNNDGRVAGEDRIMTDMLIHSIAVNLYGK